MSQEQKERKPNTSKEEELTASGFLSLLTKIQKPIWRQIPERQGQKGMVLSSCGELWSKGPDGLLWIGTERGKGYWEATGNLEPCLVGSLSLC